MVCGLRRGQSRRVSYSHAIGGLPLRDCEPFDSTAVHRRLTCGYRNASTGLRQNADWTATSQCRHSACRTNPVDRRLHDRACRKYLALARHCDGITGAGNRLVDRYCPGTDGGTRFRGFRKEKKSRGICHRAMSGLAHRV